MKKTIVKTPKEKNELITRLYFEGKRYSYSDKKDGTYEVTEFENEDDK